MRLTSIALILLAAIPAALSAQAPAAPAGPPLVTLASLLDAGYEFKTMLQLSPDDQRYMYPKDPVTAYSIVVLQKGTSMASCAMPTNSILRFDANVTDTKLCRAR